MYILDYHRHSLLMYIQDIKVFNNNTIRLARFLPSATHHHDSAQGGKYLSRRDTPWNAVISPWRIALKVTINNDDKKSRAGVIGKSISR